MTLRVFRGSLMKGFSVKKDGSKGAGLKQANGENTNPLLAPTQIKKPLISDKINPEMPLLYRVYEYDIMTEAGKEYVFERDNY